jgi:hypothetical protein
MFGWDDRPSKAEVAYEIGGESPGTVYRIGKYDVTVRADGVTYTSPRRDGTDPRRTLPNMEIVDGEIRIPVSDLVSDVLARCEPAELAKSLWRNDEVRAAFRQEMAERWLAEAVTDGDRRAFLRDIKEAVHSKAVDEAVHKLTTLEYEIRSRWHTWDVIRSANNLLHDMDVRAPSGEPLRLREPDVQIGDKAWHEARERWAAEMRALFPAPALAAEAAE